jgi:tRNA (guanosine-2'-O-)-methyltransferase
MKPRDEQLFNHFSQFVSDHKKEFVQRVLSQRTRYLTVVLENIYQSQNASAVLRTCECMGIQDVHIVENTAKYQLNIRVLKGADKWLNIERYRNKSANNTETCFKKLKSEGYRILVADPAADGMSVHDLDVTENKIALVFGNELRGASEYAIQHADGKVRIPMVGFTESLNISVSAAICLNTLLSKMKQSDGSNIFLSDAEQQTIKLAWYRKIVRRSDILEREFLRTIE